MKASIGKLAVIFMLLAMAHSSHAVEITPASPVPLYSLVRVGHVENAQVFVLTIRGNTFAPVDSFSTPNGLVFTGPAGSYAVFGMEDGKQFMEVVTIGDSPVPPPPPPPPPPRTFGLADLAKKSLSLVPEPARSARTKLAESYAGAIRGIESGALVDKEAVIFYLRSENRKALAGIETQWNAWLMKLGTEVDKLEDAGKIPTIKEYKQVCQEVREGLTRD